MIDTCRYNSKPQSSFLHLFLFTKSLRIVSSTISNFTSILFPLVFVHFFSSSLENVDQEQGSVICSSRRDKGIVDDYTLYRVSCNRELLNQNTIEHTILIIIDMVIFVYKIHMKRRIVFFVIPQNILLPLMMHLIRSRVNIQYRHRT